jgi:hypothetical protein
MVVIWTESAVAVLIVAMSFRRELSFKSLAGTIY